MDQVLAQEILRYLRDQLPEMVALLRQLVLAESPSVVPDAQRAVLTPLAEALGRLNYTVRHIPGRQSGGHLYARPSQRLRHRSAQLLLGHCDTVWPRGTLQDMPIEIGEGVMRGPGVYDMKAGLVQMLYALQALHAVHREPSVTPLVFVNSDEEIGSPESTPHIRRLARLVDRALIELGNGRMIEVADGDLIVGAFGQRCATLEAVGDWRAIGEDLQMEALTSAGLFGKVTSKSAFLPALLSLTYCGHVLLAGEKLGMRAFVPLLPERPFMLPVVLIVGTSMSAGKTSAARIIVRLLKEAGLQRFSLACVLSLVGAKLVFALQD